MDKKKVLEILEDDLDKILEKRSRAIDKNDENKAIGMTKLMKDTIKLISDVKPLLKPEYKKSEWDSSILYSENWIIEKLNQSKGKLIVTNEKDRGIGKTTALVEIAVENGIPLICSDIDYVKSINPNCEAYSFHSKDAIMGKTFNGRKVLIDECCGSDIIKYLKNNDMLLVGFYYDDILQSSL